MDVSNLASAIQSGVSGYKKAEQGVEDATLQINRLQLAREQRQDIQSNQQQNNVVEQAPPVSLDAEAVNLIVNEYLAKANVKVIKTADDMMGNLIDTKV